MRKEPSRTELDGSAPLNLNCICTPFTRIESLQQAFGVPLPAGTQWDLLWEAAQLWLRASRGLRDAALKPMRLFHWSNSYLALIFVAAAVDPLLH